MDSGLKHKKPPNPRENANLLSILTFYFTIPTFRQSLKKELEVEDLYETCSQHKSSRLGDRIEVQWNKEVERAAGKNKKPSLGMVLLRTFGWEFMLLGFVSAVVELVVKVAQPIFLGYLISFYMPNQHGVSEGDAYLYAAGVVASSFFNVFLVHPQAVASCHVGMKMRVACCSLIYRKALKLSKTALGRTTVGQVVNLLSNDVNRFDIALVFAHQLWIAPLQTFLITYLMYLEVGIAALFGSLFMLLFIPLQIFLGKVTASFRLKTAIRTDERVRLMNEIISGIQVIKMYTWERPFAKLVSIARRYEVKPILSVSYVRGIIMSYILFASRTALFITIVVYLIGYGEKINAKQVFVMTGFYNVLRQSMSVYFPMGATYLAEMFVSIGRLNKFLLYDEKPPDTPSNKSTKSLQYAISIHNGTAKWTESSTDNTLSNINMNVKHGSLIAVVGPVGCGKSSLLHAILKELPLKAGSVDLGGSISFASQEPWLFTGSVRQNILFGQEMDRGRYKNVVKKCALKKDFKLLPYADMTIVGEKGASLSGGQRARINLARAVYKEADIYLLDDPLSAVDTHVGRQLFNECIRGYLSSKTVVLITHQLQYLKEVDHIIILENGAIQAEGSFAELQQSGLDFAKLLHKSEQSKNEEKDKESTLQRPVIKRQESIASIFSEEQLANMQTTFDEAKNSGSVSSNIYKAYFSSAGNFCVIFFVAMLFIIAQVLCSGTDYFITYWMNLEQERNEDQQFFTDDLVNYYNSSTNFWDFSTNTSIYIYSGLITCLIATAFVRSFAFFIVCMRASVNLHDKMFNSVIHATMRFFNTNPSGRILNRFSKDMGSIDELLPSAMIDTFQIALVLLGILIMIAIVNPWLLVPIVVIGIFFYKLRNFYLMTSINVKRLEGITRSPVFAHLNASLQGLTTIRAFNAQSILEKEFDNHQDLHSCTWSLFICTSRAFGLWLDIFCVIYIALVTYSFLAIGNEKFGGNVGLAITQALGMTLVCQWGVRQSAEVENLMTSVERVLEYTNVKQEPPFETPDNIKPSKEWPSRGEIKFEGVFLKYFPDDPPVLKNLNFTIKPLQKVGIVGRTGAGKSSLIAALFQLTDTEGAITIDGVDIKGLGLHDLRSKISIIPQEPVLFSGTLRKNLDPFDEYNDEVLWKALGEVELKEAVDDLDAGLNSKMSEGGTNFSVGQRQLLCLARAIVRNNKILIMDEATANVDPQTDTLIQHTIRRKFVDCTVLTIAHRLHTVMDSDKVLVMDAGCVVEFDHPHLLLQNPNGIFYGMVQQTGKATSEVLTRNAKESFDRFAT